MSEKSTTLVFFKEPSPEEIWFNPQLKHLLNRDDCSEALLLKRRSVIGIAKVNLSSLSGGI